MKLKHYATSKIKEWKAKVKKNWRYKKINKLLSSWLKVLDIGCAYWNFYDIRKNKNIKYSGIDYNDYFVDFCQKKWLDVKKCDISREKIPYPDSTFDVVYCSHVIEHLLTNQQIYLIKEVSRVLKK